MNLVACLGINQRAYRNLLVEPVTHLQGCHPFGQPCAKRLADRRVDVETIGRRTGLTHVAHLGDHRASDGVLYVRILEDDERCVAAKLHRRPNHIFSRSEEHTSELQSLLRNSYAVFCLKKKNTTELKSPLSTSNANTFHNNKINAY